jgi:hypothetical protein
MKPMFLHTKRRETFGRLSINFLEDDATPVMVAIDKEHCAQTYQCAIQCGDIEGFDLTAEEFVWLATFEDAKNEWFAKMREGNPEYT